MLCDALYLSELVYGVGGGSSNVAPWASCDGGEGEAGQMHISHNESLFVNPITLPI